MLRQATAKKIACVKVMKNSMKKTVSEKLSNNQRQILVGTLLGDAHLRANKNKSKYQYVVLQSDQHKEYVFHLYEIFKNYTLQPPKMYTFKDKRFPGRVYTRWSFYTTFQECFRFYGHQFYSDNPEQQNGEIDHKERDSYRRRKTVPKLIHKWLTPRAIAYWYMDDGAQKWKNNKLGYRFCTDNLTLSEIDRLTLTLREKYLLKTSIQKKGNGFRIYISSESYCILKKLIFAFLIPGMIYKFPVETLKNK